MFSFFDRMRMKFSWILLGMKFTRKIQRAAKHADTPQVSSLTSSPFYLRLFFIFSLSLSFFWWLRVLTRYTRIRNHRVSIRSRPRPHFRYLSKRSQQSLTVFFTNVKGILITESAPANTRICVFVKFWSGIFSNEFERHKIDIFEREIIYFYEIF